jgi:hypothetical protein
MAVKGVGPGGPVDAAPPAAESTELPAADQTKLAQGAQRYAQAQPKEEMLNRLGAFNPALAQALRDLESMS